MAAVEKQSSAKWGWQSPGESRWPATFSMILVIVLQALTPDRLIWGPRYVVQVLEAMLLVVLIAANPSRLDKLSRDTRRFSIALVVVLVLVNMAHLIALLNLMLNSDLKDGRELINAAVGIWITNVAAFAVWYWEIDRGGPIKRSEEIRPQPDFLFANMTEPDSAVPNWFPKFIDYAYLSLTNSLAFSPTDTLPLTRQAKLLMGAQSIISIATIVVVGARAVNILS